MIGGRIAPLLVARRRARFEFVVAFLESRYAPRLVDVAACLLQMDLDGATTRATISAGRVRQIYRRALVVLDRPVPDSRGITRG